MFWEITISLRMRNWFQLNRLTSGSEGFINWDLIILYTIFIYSIQMNLHWLFLWLIVLTQRTFSRLIYNTSKMIQCESIWNNSLLIHHNGFCEIHIWTMQRITQLNFVFLIVWLVLSLFVLKYFWNVWNDIFDFK